jgi:hypothetical protein
LHVRKTIGVLVGILVLGVTALAARAADLSTPQAAAKAFSQAVFTGDVDGAKAAAMTSSPDEEKSLEMIVQLRGAQKKMVDAAVAKFGDEGKSLYQQGGRGGGGGGNAPAPATSVEEIAKRIDDADVKTEGDTATVTPKEGRPTHLKKSGSDWKVDMSQMEGLTRLAQNPDMVDTMQKMYTELASDIDAGKYKSVDEARTAMREKMMALRGGGGGGGGMRRGGAGGAGAGGASTHPSDK